MRSKNFTMNQQTSCLIQRILFSLIFHSDVILRRLLRGVFRGVFGRGLGLTDASPFGALTGLRDGSLRTYGMSGASTRGTGLLPVCSAPVGRGEERGIKPIGRGIETPTISVRPRLAAASIWRSRTDTRGRATGGERFLSSLRFLSFSLYLSHFLILFLLLSRSNARSNDDREVWVRLSRGLSSPSLPHSPF